MGRVRFQRPRKLEFSSKAKSKDSTVRDIGPWGDITRQCFWLNKLRPVRTASRELVPRKSSIEC